LAFQVALQNSHDVGAIVELAVRAQELGFETAWLAEHILPPKLHPDPAYYAVLEPLVALGYIAARTTSLRLGTSVLVLPLRNPFLVAKQAATLDLLSNGRLDLGVGVGWDQAEFAIVGEEFRNRGARANEAIRLLRHLFSGSHEALVGRFYNYRQGVFEPVRPAGIPISIGGHSEAAIERAIELGDAWQSLYLDGHGTDPGQFAEVARRIKARTDSRVKTVIKRYARNDRDVEALIEEVPIWQAAGADDIIIWFGEIEGFGARQEKFAQAIRLPG
jgi:probable F420-dependent oxidoreductase